MGTASAYETKTHLADLLRRVQNGESITITKHGVPVAKLVPVGDGNPDVIDAIAGLRKFRDAHPLGDVTIRELIDDGRRQ
jgi:prevent-host-death family protein